MSVQSQAEPRRVSDEQRRQFLVGPAGPLRRWLLEYTDYSINVFSPRDQPAGRSERVFVREDRALSADIEAVALQLWCSDGFGTPDSWLEHIELDFPSVPATREQARRILAAVFREVADA